MPDLMTHVLTGKFITRPRHYRELFFLGLALPDLLGRVPMLLNKNSYWFINPGHTPIGAVLAGYAISFLFDSKIRAIVFRNLMLGASLHLFEDMLQRHVTDSYYWFFPFTWKTFEIPLFWPDQSLYFIPFLLAGAGAFELVRFLRKRRRSS